MYISINKCMQAIVLTIYILAKIDFHIYIAILILVNTNI